MLFMAALSQVMAQPLIEQQARTNLNGLLIGGTPTGRIAAATLSSELNYTSGVLKFAQQSATSGQVLKWNGTAWAPAADNTGSSLPSGTSTQTLRYDGTGTLVATSQITNDGTAVGIGAAPMSDFELYSAGAIRSDGILVSRGAGNVVSTNAATGLRLWNSSNTETYYISHDDDGRFTIQQSTNGAVMRVLTNGDIDVLNRLKIGSVLSVTPTGLIGRDGTGYVGTVSLGAALGLTTGILNLAQQGATTGQVLKWSGSAWTPQADNTGSGSNWTVSGSDIYRNSNVSVGTTTVGTSKLLVAGVASGIGIYANGGSITSGNTLLKATGTASSGFVYGLDADVTLTGGNVIARVRNGSATNVNTGAVVNVSVNGASVGDPQVQWQLEGVTEGTWSAGIDNSSSDDWVLSNDPTLAAGRKLHVRKSGQLGVAGDYATDMAVNWGLGYPMGVPVGASTVPTAAVAALYFNNGSGRLVYKPVSFSQYRAISSEVTPTITAGPASGAGSTVAVVGNEMAGRITVTAGTSPPTGTIVTISMPVAFTGNVFNLVVPKNANASGLGSAVFSPVMGSSSFTLTTSTALTTGQQYIWEYFLKQ